MGLLDRGATVPIDPLPGYTILDQIHEGKGTTIYRGYRQADRLPVVLKIPRSEYPSPRDIAKLRHEHAIMSQLDVPGVVRVYALEKRGRGLALVMEDMGGESLARLLGARRLGLRAALRLGVTLADTLAALHQRRVIHKDIKPHNILVRGDAEEVRLTDFGIATRLAQEAPRIQSPETVEGTLLYMSPEQTGRMNRVVDYRTDLYSLGATLYEVLTGAPPFSSADPLELVHSHIAVTPRPPREVVPGLPDVVSDLVMRLLAKPAEDRYQSALGLRHDLSECLARLTDEGRIEPFPLGRRDAPLDLRLPQKLWGREAELAALLGAVERASQGAVELVLVSGHAGVGKSTLINELPRMMASLRRPFLWAAGKFDQLARGTPYGGIARAVQDLVRQSLSEPARALERRKQELRRALGVNGRVLTDVVPEVELLLGPQPAVEELGPVETQNRFSQAFQSFIGAFATAEQPLCLLLDDLQWADPGSLKLVQRLASDPASGHLLILGAYRGEELEEGQPFAALSAELARAGVGCRRIEIAPLSADQVVALVAEALRCAEERAAPLARLLFERSRGNPFFINQLLLTLHQEGLLTFDPREGAWVWDLQRVSRVGLTDDVVALLAAKIQQLAPEAQRALELAACIGHELELKTLATIHEKPPVDTARDLWEALREGLLLPMDPEYRFVDDPGAAELFRVSYRFLHDRIQQACYALIEDSRKQEVHLRIARLLLPGGREPLDEELFELLRHQNLAADLITDPGERIELARRNLAAGRKAKAATAYQAAAGYLRAGADLLGDAGWEAQFDLLFALHAERAECEYLAGAVEEAERLLERLLSRARTRLERARVLKLRAALYLTASRFADAVSACAAALALFGVDLPTDEAGVGAALPAALAEVEVHLAGRRVDELVNAPEMVDPEQRAASEILSTLLMPGPLIGPGLFALGCATQVSLFLRHGRTELSAYGAMLYAMVLAMGLGRIQEARAFGELALALDERHRNRALACKLHEVYGICSHLFSPVRASLAHLDRAYHAGLENGDFLYLSYACFHAAAVRLSAGDELGPLRAAVDDHLALTRRTGVAICAAGLTVVRQVLKNLAGGTADRLSLSDDGFDEVAFLEAHRGADGAFVASLHAMLKAQLCFLHEDHESALALALLAHERGASAKNLYVETDLCFYTCLILLALPPSPLADEWDRRAELLARERARLAAWAESCPDNFRHKHLLVLAEAARVCGGELEAVLDAYDQAIEAAADSGFPHHAALANELCARLLLARRRPKLARLYLTEAYYGYLHWGAAAKVAHMAERYAHLLLVADPPPSLAPSATVTGSISVSTSASERVGAGAFDLISVVRAIQAISGEIVLERLLERLVRIFIENAGAQRGILLLARGEELAAAAALSVEPGQGEPGSGPSLGPGAAVAMSIVRYVQRTGEPVVLGNAAADRRFAADPHLAASRPRSVLCLAMMHQRRLTGVLYLEHHTLHGAFTPARQELLRLLASQGATAIENALLYERVQAMSQDLRRSNESLAEEVARQTEELRDVNARLLRELEERARADAERAGLQEQIIQAQRDRLAELSTPFIPITEQIMVMPLIGAMDEERAQLVLHAALRGAEAHRAAVVILDITGVKLVDARVASTLIRAARALRLLGTEVVITGIRAEVAQALVHQDVDLQGVITRATLRSGIAWALSRGRR